MKISALNNRKIDYFNNNYQQNQKKENNFVTPQINELNNFSNNNYLINFCADHDSLTDFHEKYENVLPKTYLSQSLECISANDDKKSPFEVNYEAFSALADCHSVDDIKTTFPNEPLFRELRSIFDVDTENLAKSPRKKFIETYVDMYTHPKKSKTDYMFPNTEDDDLTTYLVKKAFLDCRSQNEINADIKKDINPLFAKEGYELGELPTTIYDMLGITYSMPENMEEHNKLDKATKAKHNRLIASYRLSLVSSRADFNKVYTDVFERAKKEKAIKNIENLLFGDLKSHRTTRPKSGGVSHSSNIADSDFLRQKKETIINLAWVNDSNMRTGWANYLDNLNKTTFVSHKEYNPDFLNLSAITKNNLKQFGEQNPDVKNGFIESCKQAYESVNSAIKNRTFVELREQVLNQRQKLIDEREKKFVIANILAGVIDKKTEEEAIKLAKLNVENTEKNKIISGIMTGLIQKKEDEENIRKIKEDFEKELLETMKKIEQTAKKELQKTLDVNHPFLPKKINDELLNVMYEQVLIGDKSSDDYKKLKEKRLTIERNYHQAFVNYFNSDFFKKTGKNSKSIFFYPNSGYAGVRLAKLPEEQNRLVIAIDTHIFLELIEQLDHIAKIYTNRFNGTKEEAENILSHMQDKFSKISFPADRNSIMVLKDFKILVNSCQNYLKQKRNSKDNMKRDIYEQIQHQILIQYNKITQENNGKKKG